MFWPLAVVALFAAACAGGGGGASLRTAPATSTRPPTTATPYAPPATPTPDPAVLLQDGGIAIIEAAYNRMLDEYIRPLDDARLLDVAWRAAAATASALGARVPREPPFRGDRSTDFAAFGDGYVAMTAGVADAKAVRFAAIGAMATSVNDCHTFFLNPVASDTLVDQRAGKGSVGVGIELASVPPLVTEVIPGGPADRAGVLIGDRITAIDGTDASSFGPASAFDLINGSEGTSVRLALRRSGAPGVITVSMLRARVVPPNVEPRLLGATGIGYVRVREFIDGGIAGPLQAALMQFEAQGVRKWIIDMRGNPGGRLDVDAISLFVRQGVIVRDTGRSGAPEQQSASGKTLPVLRPTVLLTDNGTGSVAEIFAAALKEYRAAYLIGARTNGCVGYTDVSPLGDGSSLAVTTNVNLGPLTGAPLNGVGVAPDEAVGRTNADIAAGRDPQLDAALAYLRALGG
ncbi:MAG: PDZ domain-containing protein [Dehalococcoidia bacterium]|nr:PDZ domain-containing protein [Dehalococcoidia bacterium]